MSLDKEEAIFLEELKDRKTVVGEIFLNYLKKRDGINKSELEKIVKKLVKEGKIILDPNHRIEGKDYTFFTFKKS
jgi:hypothetical protein